ncbi:MAG TPA: hypothetical protein VHY35_16310 [Stellaceae bacterium]|nr:hypothetical protein [Stellaceae bacterium]
MASAIVPVTLKAVLPSEPPPVIVPVPVMLTAPSAVSVPPVCVKFWAKLAVVRIVRLPPFILKKSLPTDSESITYASPPLYVIVRIVGVLITTSLLLFGKPALQFAPLAPQSALDIPIQVSVVAIRCSLAFADFPQLVRGV